MKFDFIVVGSGAAGAIAAYNLRERGFEVALIEEGKKIERADFRPDMFSTMYRMFRDAGMQMAQGKSRRNAVIPILQGRCVGGSTVINGGIIHRLPQRIFEYWTNNALIEGISFKDLEAHSERLERKLQVSANIEEAFQKTCLREILMRREWKHEVMRRNAPGCKSSGRCLQGCPTGGKWSMERSLIPEFETRGGRLLSGTRVSRLTRKSSEWKLDTSQGTYRARKIVLAAGAIHSADLIWQSGFRHPLLGQGFQMHLSAGVCALMKNKVSELEGPPQGVEIREFDQRKIKLATQLMPTEMMLARTPLIGEDLRSALSEPEKISNWMVSIQSEAKGEVRFHRFGKPTIFFEPTPRDLERARFGLYQASDLLFELGATRVFPGVSHPDCMDFKNAQEAKRLLEMPLDPRYYLLSAGHLFGGTNILGDQGVVDSSFRVQGMENVFVVDAGIFPTNIGVNPQHSIMALASLAGERISEI